MSLNDYLYDNVDCYRSTVDFLGGKIGATAISKETSCVISLDILSNSDGIDRINPREIEYETVETFSWGLVVEKFQPKVKNEDQNNNMRLRGE